MCRITNGLFRANLLSEMKSIDHDWCQWEYVAYSFVYRWIVICAKKNEYKYVRYKGQILINTMIWYVPSLQVSKRQQFAFDDWYIQLSACMQKSALRESFPRIYSRRTCVMRCIFERFLPTYINSQLEFNCNRKMKILVRGALCWYERAFNQLWICV